MKTIQQPINQTVSRPSMLMLLAGFCMALLLLRAKLTQSIYLFFLIWNLFLAYTPLALTYFLIFKRTLIKKWYFYPAFICWLLVLPNAPYIITDFIHLYKDSAIPVWFDILLIASFTLCGLLFGLASMKNMHRMLSIKFNNNIANVVLGISSLLSGFGIYLGRFLRYNSWDVLHKPLALTADIFNSLFANETYKAAWGITLGFGTLLYLLFRLYYEPEK
ncbi:DUF1361 domain-containing protein [Flavobacterium sp. Sd200]|uniref:DUF1361 domain-containing protein n=1 Tax=Flavobacterium sp. Sd200 TaxID=2692211 RepID=UPI001371C467|nr:DUF1361 domain-containing protein [Flavobacterium sp. Sd200]MXN90219.1 DUF1361 domain-containing protein [Flavobacterium sp. Sd200]